MTRDEAHHAIVEAFLEVAPDADPTQVPLDARYRDALSIDSMDFLAILEEVERLTGVSVPESDYGRIETIEGFIAYLEQRSN